MLENEIVRVVKEGEVLGEPIKISIGVNLPREQIWYWVEFLVWGHGCGTLFTDLTEALHWCTVGYDRNLFRPMKIKDSLGKTLYDEQAIEDYVRVRS